MGSFFFLLLSFAALTYTVSLLEVPVSYAVDEFNIRRNRAVVIMSSIIFLAGIPSMIGNGYSGFFTNFITYVGADSATDFMSFFGNIADVLLLLGGSLIVFFAAHVWKTQNLNKELSEGYPEYEGSVIQKFLNFTISYLCQFILAVLFVLVVLSNFFGV